MRANRRTVISLGAIAAAVALCALLFGRAPRAGASSFRIPTDGDETLETLPFAPSDTRRRGIAALRRALATNPRDLTRAVRLARLDITLARERSDPRHLGHAQAALAPWWSEQTPPVEVLVLRATIAQSLHDFEAALIDLDRAVNIAPEHAQAWLTRAVVLGVRGRYPEAKQSCARLVPIASKLVVAVCETSIDSVNGRAAEAYARLSEVLARSGELTPDEEGWARSSLAEFATRAGRLDDAEQHFERALKLDPGDSYARAAAADLHLDRGRPKDALALVRGREVNDTLLLRIAIAERRLGAPEAEGHIATLAARFDASRLRGDVVHRREESRFWLELRGDATRALELAQANWDVQKEPADVRVFLEAARAAKQPKEAERVLAWLAETKLEDPFIGELAGQLRARSTGAP